MNKEIFEMHLVDILARSGIDARERKYIIHPILEEGKKYNSKDEDIIELHTSLRFRKPSELQRKEYGNAPFKIMD